MIFLFKNELLDATITSLYANTNYPVTNVQSPFLYKKFKATTYGDTIRIVLPRNTSIDCFFYAYSNANAMTIRFYNNLSVLLDTKTVDCSGNARQLKSGSLYFDPLTVRIIEIDASCAVTEDLYIGGLAAGTGHYDTLPLANFDKAFEDLSEKESSDYGQVSYQYIPSLLVYNLQFAGIEREEYHGIIEQFQAVGQGFIWADISEDNHTVYQPIYCTTDYITSVERSSQRIAFNVKLTEAR